MDKQDQHNLAQTSCSQRCLEEVMVLGWLGGGGGLLWWLVRGSVHGSMVMVMMVMMVRAMQGSVVMVRGRYV